MKFYRRAYVDDDLKLFCITEVDLGLVEPLPLVGSDNELKRLKEVLKADGYTQVARRYLKVKIEEKQRKQEADRLKASARRPLRDVGTFERKSRTRD